MQALEMSSQSRLSLHFDEKLLHIISIWRSFIISYVLLDFRVLK